MKQITHISTITDEVHLAFTVEQTKVVNSEPHVLNMIKECIVEYESKNFTLDECLNYIQQWITSYHKSK